MPQVLTEPSFHQPPTKVNEEAFVVHEVQHALGEPLSVYLNSLIIRAAEPVLVDTGTQRNRKAWLEDTFSLVDPEDVRWVFISHEDVDHVGNLVEVMEMCPKATLICSWALMERFHNAFEFPLQRCKWIDDGGSFMAGDRELRALRPPVYDSPTTRGLLDVSTGLYWAVDAFATPVPGGNGANSIPTNVSELDEGFWQGAMAMFAVHALSPWVRLVDAERFSTHVSQIEQQRISTVVGAHTPVINGDRVSMLWGWLRSLPEMSVPPAPDQAALDLIIAATHTP